MAQTAKSPPAGLIGRWCRLVGQGPAQVVAGQALLARWAEPRRAYHTLAHLTAVLDRLDGLAADGVDVVDATRLAAWWHDAVYDPERADNESRSAELAAATLSDLGVDAATVAEVVRLVELTAGHRAEPGDTAGGALCDADLAILGATPVDYLAYGAGVRCEYRHLSDQEFASGRSVVLRDLLARRCLFATSAGRRHWDSAARANMAAELERLEQSR